VSQDAAKKPGRIAEIRQGYTAIRSIDKRIGWWMLLAAVGTFAVILGIGFLVGWPVYAGIVALPSALLAATLVMNRRGNKAMYGMLEGQTGATGAAIQGLGRRGWYTGPEPVAIDGVKGTRATDLAGAALVFRALGRPGVVLLGEGPPARVARLLKAEEKKVNRVAPGVPVHLWVVGDGEDQVPVRKLSGKLTRMRPVLTKAETAVVHKRLRSLGGVRPPVPAGMDPSRVRVDRKAMRGR
jgi:hypothetical protein